MGNNRPPHFPPQTEIGDHLLIEGLVRLAEGRMYYLASDRRPSVGKRYLVSARWEQSLFDAYERYHRKQLSHPGLCSPVMVLRHQDVLLSVVEYNGESLMLDEAAPFDNEAVLDLAQRAAGTLAYLHLNGVRLVDVTRTHFLLSPDGKVRLFDLEIAEARDEPIPRAERGKELPSLGELLRRYCHVEAETLADFMTTVERGTYDSPVTFGRAIEQRFDAFAAKKHRGQIACMTDVGLTRGHNEDNWSWQQLSSRAQLFVVADGMGGHEAGEVASELAVHTICRIAKEREMLAPPGADSVENLLDEAFQTANNTVKEHAEARGVDMGTTMVGVLVLEGRIGFLCNVGDSRGYLMRQGSLHQVTRDHSLVAKMVERGRITAEEARTHPHSNILLRTVGTERDVEIDIFRVELEKGDRILLCSDGLWGEVEDRDIENLLNHYEDPRIACRELVRAAHHGGGKDNVSLMLVDLTA